MAALGHERECGASMFVLISGERRLEPVAVGLYNCFARPLALYVNVFSFLPSFLSCTNRNWRALHDEVGDTWVRRFGGGVGVVRCPAEARRVCLGRRALFDVHQGRAQDHEHVHSPGESERQRQPAVCSLLLTLPPIILLLIALRCSYPPL